MNATEKTTEPRQYKYEMVTDKGVFTYWAKDFWEALKNARQDGHNVKEIR